LLVYKQTMAENLTITLCDLSFPLMV
jgi:hypothetical protein